ncbi:NAD(P)-dependent alcohol dehydrogenase [Microbacterium azadirachtae]|uniref:NAD(P)-dependent alcohol dehydrogenase n=1 Tax=Microbacterium azadirachtae TaxID=582680 RepID=UPI00087E560F|nr:NAD(P)-dependent alcohol dehydrogenase [Microbacterium azadirachtae]SDL45333.1 NADPH:quinone reductase [Microbacterium azadirachtae]SEF75598.1 NADPH:quinone reductase [Microbacterium azadirachtae]SEF76421.1 NADPH:quinone reductase [Microbacterium azadirachtae]
MRAGVVERYGPPSVVRIATVADPVAGRGEVVVRVMAATVNSGDARIRGARFPRGFALPGRLALGLRGPRAAVLGVVFSGVVEEVGDRVCGMTGARMGAHAELVAVSASRLVRIDDGISFDDAAGVLFGGTTALSFLRDRAAVRPGERVLVVGAAGAVGTNAVQLAKHLGATVTAVTSAQNAELVRSLGADRVVDYRVTPTRALAEHGERFDVVFDTVGALSPKTGRPLLAEGGRLLLAAATLGEIIAARGPVKTGTAPQRPEDFTTLLDLVGSGALRVVVDDALPLDGLAAAHARVDSGRKTGNLVLHPQLAAEPL